MQKVSLAQIDIKIFIAINQYAKKSRILDFFAIFCARVLGWLLFLMLLYYAWTTQHWQVFFVPLTAALFARIIINESIYFFYKRKRPLEVMSAKVLIHKPINASFPSSHAAFFFAISFTLCLYSLPFAIAFFVVSLLQGLARIFCGVHWPSDVLAGTIVGFFSFLIMYFAKTLI